MSNDPLNNKKCLYLDMNNSKTETIKKYHTY